MATNRALDDKLIEKAKSLGHHRTRRGAVNAALVEYIQRLQQQSLLDEYGAIDYELSYDYKKQRNGRVEKHASN